MKRLYFLFLLPFFSFSQQVEVFYFDFDRSEMNPSEMSRFTEFLKNKDSLIIHKVFGYCDIKGDHPYNDILSEKRANHLVEILKENQFYFSDSIQIKGFGKRSEQSPTQAKNRKTEVWYSKIEPLKKTEKAQTIEIPVKEIGEEQFVEKPTLTELFDNTQKGDIIIIDDIHFFFDSAKIKPESEAILKELYYNLASYPPLKIEIQSHICCNPDKKGIENLSQKRARAIYKYLTKRGVSKKRVAYSYYGSTRPIYPIPEKNEAERQANRRVEILIVDK